MKTITFKRIHSASRGNSSYKADGFPGVVYLAKPAFNGEHPEELVIEGVPEPVAKKDKPAPADKIARQLAKAQARVAALLAAAESAVVITTEPTIATPVVAAEPMIVTPKAVKPVVVKKASK
jgi:hypothetical protein